MASVIFFTRSTSKSKKKKVSIRIRFRAGREVDLYATTKYKVLRNHFNNENHSLRNVADFEDYNWFKEELASLENSIISAYNRLKKEPTAHWLNAVIEKFQYPERNETVDITLTSFIKNFIKNAPTRVTMKTGRPVSYKQQREYKRTFHYFKEFCKEQKREYNFEDIDFVFYEEFLAFLYEENLATNTAGKKIQTLKIFLGAALDNGYTDNRKFQSKNFFVPREESDNIYLTVDDLSKIQKLELTGQEEKVRDLFLVGCWTGVRFGDISQIKPENKAGNYFTFRLNKTGKMVSLPQLPVTKQILKKYNGVLPKRISNQKFNKHLKTIAEKAKLNDNVEKAITKGGIKTVTVYKKWELVASHTARRSFASNAYEIGIPPHLIMPITGHTTEASFFKYIKLDSKKKASLFMENWDNLANQLKNKNETDNIQV